MQSDNCDAIFKFLCPQVLPDTWIWKKSKSHTRHRKVRLFACSLFLFSLLPTPSVCSHQRTHSPTQFSPSLSFFFWLFTLLCLLSSSLPCSLTVAKRFIGLVPTADLATTPRGVFSVTVKEDNEGCSPPTLPIIPRLKSAVDLPSCVVIAIVVASDLAPQPHHDDSSFSFSPLPRNSYVLRRIYRIS